MQEEYRGLLLVLFLQAGLLGGLLLLLLIKGTLAHLLEGVGQFWWQIRSEG
jgi:hypothetical protein